MGNKINDPIVRLREMVGAFIIPADKYSGVNGVPEKRTEEDIFGK